VQQQRDERQSRRRGRPLEHRHLQDQPPDPLRRLHRGEQAHVRAEGNPAKHHLIDAEFAEQAQHLLGVKIHPVRAGLPWLVAAAMAQQVKQHNAVAAGGQSAGQAAAQVGVEQQRVQPDEHPVALAVDLVRQPVLTKDQRAPRTFGACYSGPMTIH
jgi:hypothetical protein